MKQNNNTEQHRIESQDVKWAPTPRQIQALERTEDEILYGG